MMDGTSLIVLLLVGLIAGFLASHVMSGHGFGLLGDLVIGVLGAFLGTWIAAKLGIVVAGLLALIIAAFVGAVILLMLLRLVTGGLGGRRSYGTRRGWF
jgi:uncharacterized membrane protein YeaQ/YmgE (transglycosylase-associated protein family)